MSQQSLERAVPGGATLLLDTSVLIAYLAGDETVSPVALHLIDRFVREARNRAIVSMVSAMEVLVRPLRHGAESYLQVVSFLTRFPNLQLRPIDFAEADQAAKLRAAHNLSAPDALIVATGMVAAAHLVTNDQAWRAKLDRLSAGPSVCYLRDHLPFP